jgi:hypothetical protein
MAHFLSRCFVLYVFCDVDNLLDGFFIGDII